MTGSGDGRINRLDFRVPAAALGGYLALSLGLFGVPVIAHPAGVTLGGRGDPSLFIWCLTWWPYAILHRLNPFITKVVYAPAGFNLAWATAVPTIALLVAPLTLAVGPVITFNLLMLLAPALAAWTAFLLCRHITGRIVPALFGGYVYGFSSYQIGHIWAGHLNLTSTFLLPLALLLCVVWYEGKVRPITFIVVLAAILVLQFGISQELFTTATLFGGVALALAVIIDKNRRARHVRLAAYVLGAYVLAGMILIPYLSYAFAKTSSLLGARDYGTGFLSIDLANYLIPTPLTALGGSLLAPVTKRFVDNLGEAGGYVGVPLMLIVLLAVRAYWRNAAGRTAIATGSLIGLCALGPILHILGHPYGWRFGIYMPWKALSRLPLLGLAVPARLTVYLALLAAVGLATWLAQGPRLGRAKAALAVLSVLFLLPNIRMPGLYAERRVPEFFDQGTYKAYLRPGETVLVLPYEDQMMLWQATTGMYFRMAGGYLRFQDPPELTRWRIFPSLASGEAFVGYGSELKAFLRAHAVATVIVARLPDSGGPSDSTVQENYRYWRSFFSPVLGPGTEVGDVTLYRVPRD